MSKVKEQAGWVVQAHALSDDISADEPALLLELAGVLVSWPARNIVTRKALHHAAQLLMEEAQRGIA